MASRLTLFAAAVALTLSAAAQTPKSASSTPEYTLIQGTVSDSLGLTPMSQAQVTLYDDLMKEPLATVQTSPDGHYQFRAPKRERYRVVADKATYFMQEQTLLWPEASTTADLLMRRKPGYVFDITIFDKAFEHNPINTLRDCKVEIYNNTTKQQELAIERMPKSTFNFSFAEGNHYTMLVRKPGYFNRRVEIYVNVNGCILCVDGMGVKQPEVVPIMSHNNEIGHFLGMLDLDSIKVGHRFELKNIYYDFDKWAIRPEAAKVLDKLATFLKDNPGISVELGSHTDSRGADTYNMTLSDKRAASAVEYLVSVQGIDEQNITSKGYGESQLINRCDDGISCSEDEHQMNRRTEIKVTGLMLKDPLWDKSLKQIIEDPQLYRKVIDLEKHKKNLATRAKQP
ncbi:MAG TPA: OmpA family protein [Saprospiraceae bacterium]|nr:OmpA family protein [Saprospiraceae bacterium]HNG89683.1 OmpA family protein [Saprospiraceae bacterium]